MKHVALLGLGIMGSGMAANWLSKGFSLTVYNRTPSKADPLVYQGAQVAATPRLAAENADVVVSMVGDDAASRAVWLGDDGALAGARPDTVLVECSTLTPDWIRDLAEQAKACDCPFLDSPVTGSRAAAADGQLTMLVGGDAAALEKIRPVLEAVSKQIVHLGPIGAGATWKLINNVMAAVHMVALSEGMVLAERAGLDMQQVASLVVNSASASPIVKGKTPRLDAQDYTDPDFALHWMHKDASYALALAEKFDLHMPVAKAAAEVYRLAREKGLNDLDFAAVIEALR